MDIEALVPASVSHHDCLFLSCLVYSASKLHWSFHTIPHWLNPSSLESVIRQWSRSWVCNRIIHWWYKALELVLAEEDLVWLALLCTTTDLVTVLTQRTHCPLFVTGTRSCKWTGLTVPELPGSRSTVCYFHLRIHSKMLFTVVQLWFVLKEDYNNNNNNNTCFVIGFILVLTLIEVGSRHAKAVLEFEDVFGLRYVLCTVS